jgi:hypothetical protein
MAKGRKTGGRKKGTPNKFSLTHVQALCLKKKFDPIDKAIGLYKKLQPHQQFAVCQFVAQYAYRKQKPEEPAGPGAKAPQTQQQTPPADPVGPMSQADTADLLKVLQQPQNGKTDAASASSA